MLLVIGDDRFDSIASVIKTMADAGYPMTKTFNPHLMCWSGKDWIMRKRFKVGVIDYELLIDIESAALEKAITMRYGRTE
jgi:hypothetical protein